MEASSDAGGSSGTRALQRLDRSNPLGQNAIFALEGRYLPLQPAARLRCGLLVRFHSIQTSSKKFIEEKERYKTPVVAQMILCSAMLMAKLPATHLEPQFDAPSQKSTVPVLDQPFRACQMALPRAACSEWLANGIDGENQRAASSHSAPSRSASRRPR